MSRSLVGWPLFGIPDRFSLRLPLPPHPPRPPPQHRPGTSGQGKGQTCINAHLLCRSICDNERSQRQGSGPTDG